MARTRKRQTNSAVRLLIAFLLGQGVQLVIHAVCFNYWEQYQLPFCAAAGFLVAVAVFAGMRVATREAESAAAHIRYEDMQ